MGAGARGESRRLDPGLNQARDPGPLIAGRRRRRLAKLVPLAMPPAMAAAFAVSVRRWGAHRGYIAGFAIYWATCIALSGLLVGRRRMTALIRRAAPLPEPRVTPLALLLLPAAGAVATELRPALRSAGPRLVAASLAIATVNAVAEEALWRGVPVSEFPDDARHGWLLPAAGFTLWHLVPIAATRRWSRAPAVLAGAALIGCGYGWVAWRTRSLRWTIPPHIVADASGLRSVRRLWLRPSA